MIGYYIERFEIQMYKPGKSVIGNLIRAKELSMINILKSYQ